MKRIIYCIPVLALLFGCVKEMDTDVRTYDCFYATVEEDDDATRAHFEQSAVKWDSNDEIGIFSDKQTSPLPFTRNSSGSFVNSSGISGSTFYAFYPSTGSRMSNDSYLVTFSIPAPAFNQTGIKMPMVATGSGNSLSFKQSCGVLHFYIKGSGSYDKISLKSNNGTYIAGTGQVDLSASYPVLSLISDISTEIVGSVPSGLNWQNGVDVYFVLPPLPLNKGFTLTLENTGTNTKLSKSTDKSVTITRQKMTRYTLDLDELVMTESGKPYVDLGLSVMWATYNVGATKPEEYGDYFAWGETSPKNNYSWTTYIWCNGTSTSMNKYNSISSYGKTDNKSVLSLDDDAAHVNWGGDWRMPTLEEMDELRNNCVSEWTTVNGVYGRRFTSKVTGYTDKSIFLPAAGYCGGTSMTGVGSSGTYWSSSLNVSIPNSAYYLKLNSGSTSGANYYRFYGQSVRPVIEQYIPVSGVSLESGIQLGVGSEYTLQPTFLPENASNKNVTWKSDNSNVAKVENNGKVTAVSVGNAVITVTTQDGNKTAQCYVKVTMAVPDAVDLGLSVKWGSFNLGATKPGGVGSHFSWGELAHKTYYDWSSYSLCNGSQSSINKYSTTDGRSVLDASNDAAAYNLGGFWRMPTKVEIEELLNNCSWTWTSQDGTWGYRVTSKISGYTNKSIFLPVTGRYNGSNKYGSSSDGKYWSSLRHSDYQDSAYMLDFDNENHRSVSYSDRYLGLAIRPVYDEPSSSVGQAVDLGLSVKWASWNVGASKSQDSGSYFAWGDPGTRSYFGWPSYKWCVVDNNWNFSYFTKYNTLSAKGPVDNITFVDASDDAAHVLWGGKWRMPTTFEINELLTQCDWTWTSVGNANGYRVKGKNNNSIFLPAAGHIEGASLMGYGAHGYYWSSQLSSANSEYGHFIDLTSSGASKGGCDRSYGVPIRPVWSEYEWKRLSKKGSITDGLLLPLFSGPDITVACDVYEEVNTPGLYMITGFQLELVAYFYGVSTDVLAPYEGEDGNWFNSQIIIDATNPDEVTIKEQPYGVYVNSTYGYVSIRSVSPGTFSKGVISFPAKKVYVYLSGNNNSYPCNTNGTFRITLSGGASAPSVSNSSIVKNGLRKEFEKKF